MFTLRPGGSAEDDGWLLTVEIPGPEPRLACLVILDAADHRSGGPVATAELTHHIHRDSAAISAPSTDAVTPRALPAAAGVIDRRVDRGGALWPRAHQSPTGTGSDAGGATCALADLPPRSRRHRPTDPCGWPVSLSAMTAWSSGIVRHLPQQHKGYYREIRGRTPGRRQPRDPPHHHRRQPADRPAAVLLHRRPLRLVLRISAQGGTLITPVTYRLDTKRSSRPSTSIPRSARRQRSGDTSAGIWMWPDLSARRLAGTGRFGPSCSSGGGSDESQQSRPGSPVPASRSSTPWWMLSSTTPGSNSNCADRTIRHPTGSSPIHRSDAVRRPPGPSNAISSRYPGQRCSVVQRTHGHHVSSMSASASGPPRCGQIAPSARSELSRRRKTATWKPFTANARPSRGNVVDVTQGVLAHLTGTSGSGISGNDDRN